MRLSLHDVYAEGTAGFWAIVRLPEYVEKDKSKVQRACSKVCVYMHILVSTCM